MSTPTQITDQDRALHSVLEDAWQAATDKGHDMDPWKFGDAPPREFLAMARCTRCNAELVVRVPVAESIDVFPMPVIDEFSAAFRYTCINPKRRVTE